VIALQGVGLERRTREEYAHDLKGRLFALAAGRYRRPPRRIVLEGIDLTIHSGEKVGIIGPNGAGKSTLLKVMCGVLMPTTGTVDVHGRIAPLLELSAGFDPDLSVADNVVLYGVLLGMERRAIEARVSEILRFADLESYRRLPVSTLSSGMAARLGFSVVTDVDADILLVDEALSVGDEGFRAKSRGRIEALWHADRTVVLVSHDLTLIRTVCERAIWLSHGRILADGDPESVTVDYTRAVDEAAIDALLRSRVDA
jgi:ABC-type polysaccharide/polyol phosphate transport system ATPase subunit